MIRTPKAPGSRIVRDAMAAGLVVLLLGVIFGSESAVIYALTLTGGLVLGTVADRIN